MPIPGWHEQVKNWAQAVQAITIAIAVLIGGIWTAYTFSALRLASQLGTNRDAKRTVSDPSPGMGKLTP